MTWRAKAKELEEAITQLGMKAGMKPLHARIHAITFLYPGKISMDEIAEMTGYSLASVSGAIKDLENIKHIKRIKHPGSKRVFVASEKNMVISIYNHFRFMLDNALKPLQDLLLPAIDEFEEALKKRSLKAAEKEALQQKIDWYKCYLGQNQIIQDIFAKYEEEFKKKAVEYRSL